MSKVEMTSITSGGLNGDRVWVCDYRVPDINKKAIRNLPPTLVEIRTNEEIPYVTVHYSESHFRPVGKNGAVKKSVIKPFDNTGFRCYTGVPLKVFTTKEECVEYFKAQVEEVKVKYDHQANVASKRWKAMSQELQTLLEGFEE